MYVDSIPYLLKTYVRMFLLVGFFTMNDLEIHGLQKNYARQKGNNAEKNMQKV